ncbi:MAG: GRP family sugar transporter [Prolixibacteraceae bacterium]|nr:GRP family sugar transporter [Prolixibacteraceae bacterium]
MYIVNSYSLAVILCIVTMICWGSWANTQKLAGKTWRQELYYWDYVIGVLLLSILMAFTFGSIGEHGRGFVEDIQQVSWGNILSAFTGGVIFNASNILLTAAIAIVGLSVAFPVGVGIGLVFGVVINYIGQPKGDPFTLFIGVLLIVTAIIIDGIAAGKMGGTKETGMNKKGLILSIAAGLLISFFYRFVAASMDMDNFESPAPQMATPYTAFFIFSLGMFVSNFLFNTLIMKKPFVGTPIGYREYFKGSFKIHLVGISGGLIWGLGSALSYMAAGKAGAAVSYALGQGATMVAALWGLLIWKEFKGAPKSVNVMLVFMILLFVLGLALIIISGGN